ncbi:MULTISPECIES: hypothetical protein [unclassified Oceanispirochaeta]|uniref:hypothetical protein n=1 Tax=unclassified Oceanispirochaeta TaxID=2635722 RepID=UPI000E09D974|nr:MULTISPECIES: hypothetical protein [unclassified Oceanispirochaeta]MBF9017505.1 hypothetical protein [Oceanispirochaeta sp. M2]NPD74077.1 hypothetical protein [Oceanispirochaeta sp. M1]RDG30118.1 hypothetical protein DV872_18430 [Oceanispirochaeta sp. M1]
MNADKKNEDKSSWATGGGVLLGLGIGFFFLQTSVFAFIGCMLAGLGLGLILTAILSKSK